MSARIDAPGSLKASDAHFRFATYLLSAMSTQPNIPQGSQYAYQIANTLDADKEDPLYLLVRTPLNMAVHLAKGDSNTT